MSLLKLSNVNLYYDQVWAVKNVSFNIAEGETVALIGANGAGKSSILRAITGLSKISQGSIEYDNIDLKGVVASEIVNRGITMVPEGRRVFPYMSIEDNLKIGAFTRNDKEAVAEDLEKMLTRFPRLRERYKQQAGTLSGGEQQMLVIGRALMGRPRLLLLDEPSLGIAPKLVQDIARSIVEINKKDKVSVILVEQNSRMALKISHRAYALNLGEVAIEGKSSDLISDQRIIDLYLGGGGDTDAKKKVTAKKKATAKKAPEKKVTAKKKTPAKKTSAKKKTGSKAKK